MANNPGVPISPVDASRPELTITAASINPEPIELEATPISFEQARMNRRSSKAFALDAIEAERTVAATEREEREKLISERKEDPAVMVDIPQMPGAEELQQSGAADDENVDAAGMARSSTGTSS